jgi:predicted 3-demethylubiquinone-9 3-methyltransferase (glyoxalase superfamily)
MEGPIFKFSEAISFQIFCETQADIDELGNSLKMGKKGSVVEEKTSNGLFVASTDGSFKINARPIRAERVMKAFLKMTNLTLRKYCKHSEIK